MNIRRALLSVWDKRGLVDFARALHAEFDVELISTGGTARVLTAAGLPVTLVETLSGSGEMLDGRVKTLHPAIHAAILADRDNPEHMRQLAAAGIRPIDLVVVDLYPFQQSVANPDCTFGQVIEMIDIGGVALLRAAAKNHRYVLVASTPAHRERVLGLLRAARHSGAPTDAGATLARELAGEAFRVTAAYDAAIHEWLGGGENRLLELEIGRTLRYGENPHQTAQTLFRARHPERLDLVAADLRSEQSLANATPMSFNNFLDADAAVGLCAELARAADSGVLRRVASVGYCQPQSAPSTTKEHPAACAVFIKHTNPCGVGVAADPVEAYRRAYLGDPNAAMGGILAVNFPVDADFAAVVLDTYDRFGKPLKDAGAAHAPGGFFVEVWIAPHFSAAAVDLIRGPRKKWGASARLLAVGDLNTAIEPNCRQLRSIAGGLLSQTPDARGLDESQWRVVTRRAPSTAEMADLRLAWLVSKHTRSNAISIVRDGRLLGNGAGQMSRVMSCRIATWLARENGHLAADSGGSGAAPLSSDAGSSLTEQPTPVAASDAFFPFPDGPQILLDAGVTALIQPGGSKRDEETIALCDARGAAMIFTGTRHFRH